MTISLEHIFNSLNTSKYFSGIMMIMLNIGGKQISNEISSFQENILNHKVMRRLLVFVVVFIATKDVKISLIVTICFIIIVTGFFHEDSKYCIVRNNTFKNKTKVSKDEYLMAKRIVEKYEKKQI